MSQYYYCPRRAALIMLEQAWSDNEYTAAGTLEHSNVHTQHVEKRGELARIYDMYVSSERLGLAGMCDCVEAERDDSGVYIPMLGDKYRLFPVEYKHGRIRSETEYNVQLCAQAICLEDMFGCSIDSGAVFYITAHRRSQVIFTDSLRKMVADGVDDIRRIESSMIVPQARYSSRCMKCSIAELCSPQIKGSAAEYMERLIDECCEK